MTETPKLIYPTHPKPGTITLQYLGNCCIFLVSSDGTRIVSDPYSDIEHPDGLTNLPADLTAEAVTISHTHDDHNFPQGVHGNPQVFTQPGVYQVGNIRVTGFAGREGSPHGPSETMANTIFCFESDGVKIVNLGDSGPVTDDTVLKGITDADIVIVNIDGYVIPHTEVIPFMQRIKARTVILAHYTLDGFQSWCEAPTADEFLATVSDEIKKVHLEDTIQVLSGMPYQIAAVSPALLIRRS
jgi:L-ascorbate metabolism protein UlaG (beta-lactamase superfamily)